MFVKVKLSGNLALGTVVSYDSTNSNWTTAVNDNDLIGVVNQAPVQDSETQEYWALVVFAGLANALADRAIPDQGGELCVLNGKVFVDNSMDGCGIIAPKPRDLPSRVANDLVMVHLR